jgi:hypothetical protein
MQLTIVMVFAVAACPKSACLKGSEDGTNQFAK